MLTINYIDIANIDESIYHFLKKTVSYERQKKAAQFRYFDDAKRCIFAELLLKYSFFEKNGLSQDIELGYNEFGKPFINGSGGQNEGFLYNISHSGKWVVIAYGDVPVGVDIEQICDTVEDLPIEAFTEEEKDYIGAVIDEERARRFTQTWTLKESYVKYIGTGLSTDLNSFSILIGDMIKVKGQDGIQENLELGCQLFEADYYLSICSTQKEWLLNEIKLIDLVDFAHNIKKQRVV